MKTFLIAVLGMFLGGILLLVVLWYGIKFLIRHFLNKLVKAFEGLGGNLVPPFRITLEAADDLKWKNLAAVDAATDALVGLGYERISDFRINEMFNVRLRALVNWQMNTYGVVFEPNDKRVVLDIACNFVDGEHATVSTAPETGLDRPEFSRLVRIAGDIATDAGLVATLHERMVAEQNGRPTVAAAADSFSEFFAAAHAREMDWRIARGGVTAEEVRRSAEVAGNEPPDEDAVKLVQTMWRAAIARFVEERLRAKFLNYLNRMSAAEWEAVRDRLYFVHEHSDRDLLITELGEHLGMADVELDPDGPDLGTQETDSRLRPLFDGAPVRVAFAKAQDLLPSERRYRRLVGIKTPYGADVYVAPKNGDDDDDDEDEEDED